MANENFNQSAGVVFSGLSGSKSGTNNNGTCYYYGIEPSTKTFAYSKKLSRIPGGSIDTTASLFEGDIRNSALNFELVFDDEVCSEFLNETAPDSLNRVYQQNLYSLTADINATETTFDIDRTTGVSPFISNGAFIYIGDEAMQVQSRSGDTYTVTRGALNTTATRHPKSVVRTTKGLKRFDTAELVLNDGDGDQTYWRGLVDEVRSSNDGTKLQISTKELFSIIRKAKINRSPINLNSQNDWSKVTFSNNKSNVRWSQSTTTEYVPKFRKLNEISTGNFAFFSVDGQLVEWQYDSTNGFGTKGLAKYWNSVLEPEDEPGETPIEGGVYECFVIRNIPESTTPSNLDRSITEGLTYPFHPLAIAMAILTSTYADDAGVAASEYDVLNGDLGLGLPISLFDKTAIDNLIEDTSDVKIERLLFGFDGKPVNAWNLITEKLLKPYNFFFGTTTDGKLTFGRLGIMNIKDYASATNNAVSVLPDLLRFETAREDTTNAIQLSIGGFPWNEPQEVFLDIRSGNSRENTKSGIFGETRSYSIDYSTQPKSNDPLGVNSKVIGRALEKVTLGALPIPRFTFLVKDSEVTGTNLDIGAHVSISSLDVQSAWIPGPDGQRVSLAGTPNIRFSGLIIGRKFNIETRTYEITVLLTNYRYGQIAKWRAPAGVVASVSTNTITIEQNAFHDGSVDASYFTTGDEVQIWNTIGTIVSSEVREITGISGNVLTLASAFTSSPTAGQIVRLAERGSYSNTTVPDVTGFARPYAYYGDNANTIGASTDLADIYG
jgi:hypothetical protein